MRKEPEYLLSNGLAKPSRSPWSSPCLFIAKLDLLKGYWQVPLTTRASDISSFVTPDHFLKYTVMAFGMRNAPGTFQRLMQLVLGDVPHCNVYLDDVVVYSDT